MGTTKTTVSTSDGRRVEIMHSDLADRGVVVVHGGTPSGLAEWPWFEDLVTAAGLGVVAMNRPGYGASSPRPDRTVAMVAEDTGAVLDQLGVEEFVSLGISGGGPHALADAAMLGERCRGVVDVAGLAPMDLDGLDFAAGMGDDNRAFFDAARGGPAAIQPVADGYEAMMTNLTPELLLEVAPTMFIAPDAAVLAGPEGPAFASYFAAMTSAAFSGGTAGLVDDMVALTRPWGFELAAVNAPLFIWHGELDENVPIGHSRAIAAALPSTTTRFRPEHAHLSIMLELPSIIDDVAALTRGCPPSRGAW